MSSKDKEDAMKKLAKCKQNTKKLNEKENTKRTEQQREGKTAFNCLQVFVCLHVCCVCVCVCFLHEFSQRRTHR